MNAAILAPLLLSYAVPDDGKLDGPTIAADRCVSSLTSGKFDETPLTSNGWAVDKESGTGAFKNSTLYVNKPLKSLVVVGKAKDGKPKCSVYVFNTEKQFDLIEYRLAAHFNGRLFPLSASSTGYAVPGHKVAVFTARTKVKGDPMMEITVVPYEPERK